ncbi:MAG TPA: glycine--tRNA ligase subunit beta [Kofleriaceae bacterium]|nr:glycine--tRNA ligase subunit beta [Kofleriaceae bacterium]
MPADLLFEIGCEEIPAKMLTRQLVELPVLVEKRLADARLEHKGIATYGTPRRLAVIVRGLAERQPDLEEEVTGPPAGAAFAADGSVTKAGQGFAAKNGVDPGTLQKKEVPGKKGLYAIAVRSVKGQDTRALLPALLTDLAKSITWPKSQRWGWSEVTFVRPIQWLVVLFGGEVIPVTWAGLTATRNSRGHRFLANHAVEIASAEAYVEALRAAHVVVDPETRKEDVLAELSRLEKETGLRVRPDDALLAEVIHLGEYPVGVSGQFDPAFLEVPEEMIVTAMRTHQRYFAMEHEDGKLANRFATLMATIVRDTKVVAHGNEKVLASRLSDAKFFFGEDKKKTAADWNTKLDAVVFQAKLGDKAKTIGQKVRRLVRLVESQCVDRDIDVSVAVRAAELCKADLASSAVGEFPELQGTMGRHYARIAGEPDGVAHAIEQHWWPKGQGGALPVTPEAALVAIADRVDTLVGCFATGLIPSGNADPLGLRRAAIGVLAILLDRGPEGARGGRRFPRSTDGLIDAATAAYDGAVTLSAPAREQLADFFKSRLRSMLVDEEGLDVQAVEVALAGDASDPTDVRARARHLAKVPPDTRAAFKRIANILDDAKKKGFGQQKQPAANAFTSPVEHALWDAYRGRTEAIASSITRHEYTEAFRALAELGPSLAAYFDKGGVMVMDPDPTLRENRLAMLSAIYEQFVQIGDFRKLGGAQ